MSENPLREKLPPSRRGICVELACRLGPNEFKFDAHYNFYADGRLAEMFARPFKTGADLESLLDKFCIAVSMLLQHGARIEEFWHSTNDDTPADHRDIFSAVVVGGVEAEKGLIAEMDAIAAGEDRR